MLLISKFFRYFCLIFFIYIIRCYAEIYRFGFGCSGSGWPCRFYFLRTFLPKLGADFLSGLGGFGDFSVGLGHKEGEPILRMSPPFCL